MECKLADRIMAAMNADSKRRFRTVTRRRAKDRHLRPSGRADDVARSHTRYKIAQRYNCSKTGHFAGVCLTNKIWALYDGHR